MTFPRDKDNKTLLCTNKQVINEVTSCSHLGVINGNRNFRSHVQYHRWNFRTWYFRSLEHSLPGAKATWNFRSLEHSLPNAKSKTWSFRSLCFKCVFLSKVTRIASSMLNRYTFVTSPPHTICLQTYSKISWSSAGTQHQVDERIERKLLPDAWQSLLAWFSPVLPKPVSPKPD